jgi:hypothetical protein
MTLTLALSQRERGLDRWGMLYIFSDLGVLC